jgi:hypothetical protein
MPSSKPATSSKSPKPAARVAGKTRSKVASPEAGGGKPRLLSGGNPQIEKGYGEAPVRAYIAAMPGWKRGVGRSLDAIITRTVPGVRKAVKWNSPLYGSGDEGSGWFLSFHCFDRYIKVAFFRGAELDPPPPVGSRQKHVRYLHVFEEGAGEAFDESRFARWVLLASRLPGEVM